MLLAQASDGTRRRATPRAHAVCRQCGGVVFAKCGRFVAWHWAHRADECDRWAEGESEWHLGWKAAVHDAACEVVLGEHRADIRTDAGLVVELQHSAIGPAVISEREAFYGDMVWLFDARAFDLSLYPSGAELSFVWRHPRKSISTAQKPIYFDVGSGFVLFVGELRPSAALGGFQGRGVLLDSACWASQRFGNSADERIHAAARARASRVEACFALSRALLSEKPRIGLDGAMRHAFKKLSLSAPVDPPRPVRTRASRHASG